MTITNEHEVIESYNEKKESFLKHTTVLEFQRAVVSRVEPILASGMAVVIIKVPKKMARHRTLKHIEELAMEGFEGLSQEIHPVTCRARLHNHILDFPQEAEW